MGAQRISKVDHHLDQALAANHSEKLNKQSGKDFVSVLKGENRESCTLNMANGLELDEESKKLKNGKNEIIYKYNMQYEGIFKQPVPKGNVQTTIWRIFPSVCASFTSIPFGLMLGWPSPNYPTLTQPHSPIPITMDQSAMVAGFLMLGISFGTMVSTKCIGPGPKYGIIFGCIFILLGWIIMWQAQDVYYLLGSRFLLGMAHGYATGQVKTYIAEMTKGELTIQLTKQLYFYGLFGYVVAYVIGPFIDFRLFSLVSIVLSMFILFMVIFLPSTPRELIRARKLLHARTLLRFLNPDTDSESELYTVIHKMSHKEEQDGFTDILRDNNLKINFIKLTILVIYMQYCGAPPTMVYTQIMFTKSEVPHPEFMALGYAVLFFISALIGTFVSPIYNKKVVLLLSSYSILILYVCAILVIYFKINETYFSYTSVIIMYLFIAVHTIGLGSIPITLINDWFPHSYRVFVMKYFIILFSLLALTITKIFQVLITQFPLYVPFLLFSGVIVFAIIFISIFIPYDIKANSSISCKAPEMDKFP
ncbi:solute carrier family 2, facilitated glucose transporter member 8-like isoform X2 [Euwallacea fornicatus]|uniref:solute carrier family 2, facilitated glucose transporter member 8-like isoform X2 n=1 Tax=Euwallacea fornicatus TaxID=995702 RepID=UPI00338DF607